MGSRCLKPAPHLSWSQGIWSFWYQLQLSRLRSCCGASSLVLEGQKTPLSLADTPPMSPPIPAPLAWSSSGKVPALCRVTELSPSRGWLGGCHIPAPSQPCLCRACARLTALTWALYLYSIIFNCARHFKIHFSHSQDPAQELWL